MPCDVTGIFVRVPFFPLFAAVFSTPRSSRTTAVVGHRAPRTSRRWRRRSEATPSRAASTSTRGRFDPPFLYFEQGGDGGHRLFRLSPVGLGGFVVEAVIATVADHPKDLPVAARHEVHVL